MKKGYKKILPAIILSGLVILVLYNIVFKQTNKEFAEALPVMSQNAESEFLQNPAVSYGIMMILESNLQAEVTAEPESEEPSASEEESEPEVQIEETNQEKILEEEQEKSEHWEIFQAYGYFENFPFLEINKTEWENDRLLCVEVSIECENYTVNLESGDIDVHFETPVLLEESTAIDKINQDLGRQYEIALEEYNEWVDFCKEVASPGGVYVWDCFLSYNCDGVINFGIALQSSAGGPMSRELHSYTYDLNTGERLNLAEILGVKEENLQDALLEGFTNAAREEPDYILWQVYTPEGLIERLKDYTPLYNFYR